MLLSARDSEIDPLHLQPASTIFQQQQQPAHARRNGAMEDGDGGTGMITVISLAGARCSSCTVACNAPRAGGTSSSLAGCTPAIASHEDRRCQEDLPSADCRHFPVADTRYAARGGSAEC